MTPGAARRFVVDALTRWGVDGPSLDDARLVLSELTSNAVVHACSPFSVTIRPEGSLVRISVQDTSPVRPALRDNGVMGTSGRGLRLVAALSDDWGVDVTADGRPSGRRSRCDKPPAELRALRPPVRRLAGGCRWT
jgi:anti-sigma regulatory factor (Ser/Thr protein kinase)